MKFPLAAPVLIATLALSSGLGLTSTVQAKPPVDNSVNNVPVDNAGVSDSAVTGTKFSCVAEIMVTWLQLVNVPVDSQFL